MEFFDETAKKTSDMASAVLNVFQSQSVPPSNAMWIPELMTDPEDLAKLKVPAQAVNTPKEQKRRKSRRHSMDTPKFKPESYSAAFERMVADVHKNPDLETQLLQREVEMYNEASKRSAQSTAHKVKVHTLKSSEGTREKDVSVHPPHCHCVNCVTMTKRVLAEGVKNRRYSQTLVATETAARLTREASKGSMTAADNVSFQKAAEKETLVTYHSGDSAWAPVTPKASQSRRRSLF
mmetsp:Transcript_43772/g.103023  ORF Transcript_43772/g.103023 Transcript_43772/m.103023 type:complete len:236 (+) Transcript_43772:111-818(+)